MTENFPALCFARRIENRMPLPSSVPVTMRGLGTSGCVKCTRYDALTLSFMKMNASIKSEVQANKNRLTTPDTYKPVRKLPRACAARRSGGPRRRWNGRKRGLSLPRVRPVFSGLAASGLGVPSICHCSPPNNTIDEDSSTSQVSRSYSP